MKTSPEHATRAEARAHHEARLRRRKGRRRAFWISAGVIVLVLAAGATVVVMAGLKALDVRADLLEAVPLAKGLPAKVAAGAADDTAADAGKLKALSSQAVSETEDFAWRAAEWVPVIGNNFTSIRVSAESLDHIADFVVDAAPTLDISAFRPVGGAVNLAAVHELSRLVSAGADAFSDVRSDLTHLSGFGVLPQVSDAVSTLNDAVITVDDALAAMDPVLSVLPAALGEGGQRTYLLMFQGNSELRASGGNPAALALVTATDGVIELTTQATSVQFDNARPESITALDPETEHIYSDIIGRWIPNMTATPDFPTTVDIMRAWWTDEGLPAFDDVISIDPIALSYLLESTGPVALDTGETLTSENAASLLLNEVYFNYGQGNDGTEQDLFFAAAAAKIFTTLTSGVGNPITLMDGLRRATDESRLKVWSADPAIENLMSGSKLAGTLPRTNESDTVVGVYFNDTTGAKTDYYADAKITATTDQCTASGAPRFTQNIIFQNNITPDEAARLPYFITGPHYAPGVIATDVVVYTPVGASIESWDVEGADASSLVSEGSHLGRDVVRISVVTNPGTAATITVKMKGDEQTPSSEYGAFDVWTTPMVRETPVTIDAPGC